MKKLSIISILLILCFEILTNSNDILESVIFSFNIWKNNIFPSLFPFFIISQLLINYGFVELLSEILKPVMNIFRINKNCAFIIVMSMLSGFPSNAKYTKELYNNGLINSYEASKILAFSFFSNPLFILGTLSITFLGNKEVGLLILFCHYISNFFIGLIFRNYHPSPKESNKINIKDTINNIKIKNNNLGLVLTDIINNAISTLLLILGIITIFLIFTTIINQNIDLNNFNQALLNGFFEMTQGLKYISILSIPLEYKCVISCMLISFGGLSVHMQVISIISGTPIKYLPFLTARVIHAFLSSFMCYILFQIIF